MSVRQILFVLSIVIFSSSLLFASAQKKLAVFPLADKKKLFKVDEIEDATDYLRSKLAETGVFAIIAKDFQKEKIEQLRKESHQLNYDEKSQIPLGKALAADTMLIGDIGYFQNTFTISVELVDLSTETTVKAASFDFKKKVGLRSALRNIVEKLTGKKLTKVLVTKSLPKTTNTDKPGDFRQQLKTSGLSLRSYLDSHIAGETLGLIAFKADTKARGELLSDIYAKYLQNASFVIVDRKETGKVLKEIELELQGITAEKNIDKLGSMTGADYLHTGSMSILQGQVFINVKVLEVASGELIISDSLNFADTKFLKLKNVDYFFAEKKYPASAMFRSLLIPGWGQFYNDSPVRGVIYPILCAAGLTATIIFAAKPWTSTSNTVDTVVWQREMDEGKINKRNFTIALTTTLSAWVLNSLDALIEAAINNKKHK